MPKPAEACVGAEATSVGISLLKCGDFQPLPTLVSLVSGLPPKRPAVAQDSRPQRARHCAALTSP